MISQHRLYSRYCLPGWSPEKLRTTHFQIKFYARAFKSLRAKKSSFKIECDVPTSRRSKLPILMKFPIFPMFITNSVQYKEQY